MRACLTIVFHACRAVPCRVDQPRPDSVPEGILPLYLTMRDLHKTMSGVVGVEPLRLDSIMEAYVPGWIEERRRDLLTNRLPGIHKSEALKPVAPDADMPLLHSDSLNTLLWLCLQILTTFKVRRVLPRSR